MAPTRGHATRIPHTRQQLKVAERRGRERVHEVADALFVTADRDEDERGETGHRDALARAIPLCVALVLRDLDVEVREQRCAGEDTKELFDVGRAITAAEGEVRQLRPWQRPVAVRHCPGGYLQLS